jgi:probable F420-dependent oxidoreductase
VSRLKVGLQLHPQTWDLGPLRTAWRDADAAGADSLWIWDHFFAPYGEASDPHFEGWTLLAAMAVETRQAAIGMLVSCVSYRNPNLLADMARTIDHLSGGRVVLGLGSGWRELDYTEYGYEYGTVRSRALAMRVAIPTITTRLDALVPRSIGPMPIMIGGVGHEITLRTAARYAQMWNAGGPPEEFAEHNRRLDECCAEIGRDPESVERTVAIRPENLPRWEEYVAAGATHLIVMTPAPYDLQPFLDVQAAARAG